MSERRITRRALFDVFRSPPRKDEPRQKEPAQERAFDLGSFYRRREESGTATRETIPGFRLRAGLEPVETSRVGVEGMPAAPPGARKERA